MGIELSQKMVDALIIAQRNEITEYHIYRKLATIKKNKENSRVLNQIAEDELRHYHFWEKYTGKKPKPYWLKVVRYYLISRFLGLTFGIKLMEKGEEKASKGYASYVESLPEAKQISEDEETHENALIDLISEEKLDYMGAVVLGLNDALVELTGALAGLTFALRDSKLIAMAGLITGISASLSMAASAYLSAKADGDSKALKSAIYTGVAYILTVAVLVLPYLIGFNVVVSLGLMLASAVLIILFFNYYISVAKDLPFKRRFFEMAGISLGVAALSFGIGALVRIFLGVDI